VPRRRSDSNIGLLIDVITRSSYRLGLASLAAGAVMLLYDPAHAYQLLTIGAAAVGAQIGGLLDRIREPTDPPKKRRCQARANENEKSSRTRPRSPSKRSRGSGSSSLQKSTRTPTNDVPVPDLLEQWPPGYFRSRAGSARAASRTRRARGAGGPRRSRPGPRYSKILSRRAWLSDPRCRVGQRGAR
jgi:hypothetical protein